MYRNSQSILRELARTLLSTRSRLALLSMLRLLACSTMLMGVSGVRSATRIWQQRGSSLAVSPDFAGLVGRQRSRMLCASSIETPAPVAAAMAATPALKRRKVGSLLAEGESAIGTQVLLKGWVRILLLEWSKDYQWQLRFESEIGLFIMHLCLDQQLKIKAG